jgi:ferredoxin
LSSGELKERGQVTFAGYSEGDVVAKRKVVKIDEEKCDGCGLCVTACAEGAIQIVNGKAKLISDVYCDGLGACLPECPRGAITIEERKAKPFDEEAAKRHLEESRKPEPLPCGCPSTVAQVIKKPTAKMEKGKSRKFEANLANWPIQFKLVPPTAPYLKGADLLIAADCVGFAYPALQADLLPEKVTIIGCPKLGDAQALTEKLTEIFSNNNIKSVTVAHMEVPCCHGLVQIVKQSIAKSGKNIPLETVEISVRGDKKSQV